MWKSQIWQNSSENMLIWAYSYFVCKFRESVLADFSTYCIYICLFLFDASTKKLFEKFHYHVFCFCLAAVVVQVNTANNIQYL